MEKISWQRWVTVCVVLVLLGLAADYYFLHILFDQKRKALIEETVAANNASTATETENAAPAVALGKDNFLESLKTCRPDISSQGITTPEALLTYLEKSVGTESGSLGGNSFAQQGADQPNINATVVTLNDKSVLTIDARGGEVMSFQLKTDDKILTCNGADCACN